MTPTIFALASGQGRAGVAVIRLSGTASAAAIECLAHRLPAPRRATLLPLYHPGTGELLDRGLVVWFPAPHSFTGEDCAELQLHGSRAVIAAVLEALSTLPGLRLAEAGEFTRRAFLNGKLDLSAVEGLADLIDAETESQRRQALRQLDGALGAWADALRERLLDALAMAEAAIDFAEEGDVGSASLARAVDAGRAVGRDIATELQKPRRAERIRDGFVVTLAGPPNAGKSTLLNALARREAAIVSPHAGTTRDPIEVDLDLGDYAVVMIDTAGIRDTEDPVEQEGVARGRARAAAANLVLWLQDAAEAPAPPDGLQNVWTIGTKADLLPMTGAASGFDLYVSALSGAGIEALVERLLTRVADKLAGGEAGLVTQQRHRTELTEAAAALGWIGDADAELVAEDLRTAAAALGRITGRIDVEEILGAIFARFCIGK